MLHNVRYLVLVERARTELWVGHTTGSAYGFRCCSADGATTYARGTRVLVRPDSRTLRPARCSEAFRTAGRVLLRPAD